MKDKIKKKLSKFETWVGLLLVSSSALFLVTLLKLLTLFMQLLAELLRKVLDTGMSNEFKFIYMLAAIYIFIGLGKFVFDFMQRGIDLISKK